MVMQRGYVSSRSDDPSDMTLFYVEDERLSIQI